MWHLDDATLFTCALHFEYPRAETYADTRPGYTDREKRERIRAAAIEARTMLSPVPAAAWWAFRIHVTKSGARPFDIENVGKLIIDAFSKRMLTRDNSSHPALGLFDDDTVDHVRVLQVTGDRGKEDRTWVEIFARKPD